MRHFADIVQRRALDALALVVVALMGCIVVQVGANALGRATLVAFDSPWPLLDGAITINSLLELQWHMLALIGLLPSAIIWAMDRHVRVDFLYAAAGRRGKLAIELIGHVLFTLPFLWFATQASWGFAARALAMGERSRDGGLADRWMIKGVIPVALALLFAVVAFDALRQLRALARGR